MTRDRYSNDVLSAGWQKADRPVATPVELKAGLVVEEPTSGWVGAVVRWENGIVVLEDRRGRVRSFPVGPGFWIDGRPVVLTVPARRPPTQPTHTASGSRIGPSRRAVVAAPSRIYVEGRHDAELVEKVWGDDLRHIGVAVEYLGGIDDLDAIVAEFAPGPGRRLGVLVDHLVAGSKETRIVDTVMAGPYSGHVLITGHRHIDIWQAILPQAVGIRAWPDVPKGIDWKTGTCRALGWPHGDQAAIAEVWRALLGKVTSWTDLDRGLVTEVERLIDFTQEA